MPSSKSSSLSSAPPTRCRMLRLALAALAAALLVYPSSCYSLLRNRRASTRRIATTTRVPPKLRGGDPIHYASRNDGDDQHHGAVSRRELWIRAASAGLLAPVMGWPLTPVRSAQAAVGTLPELASTNAILQGITVKVADKSQQDAMIAFLVEGFECQVLRKRIRGNVEETWLGFGPEQLDIPGDFELPVSSFGRYGGHTSVHLVYDASLTSPLYRMGDDAPPGDNIAYLQLAVPGYRMSKIQATGGIIKDAYGLVNVISPSGLPIRGVVGIWPDPLMLVAINCASVADSARFYRQLGFQELPMPYSRPSNGATIFEPKPPQGSVYMSPCATGGMGVLLLPVPGRRQKTLTPNRAVQSLNVVYNPSSSADGGGDQGEASPDTPRIVDPSGVPIAFQSVSAFAAEEKETR